LARPAWPIPVLWPDGPTAVILAGGPSLDLAQVRRVAMARLEGRCRVVAVNDAVYPCWFADWLHGCDYKWWNWHRLTATKFPGVRTTCTETVPEAWAHYIKVLPPDPKTGRRGGFADEPDSVAGGGNGGYQAIQVAVKAGAKRLILLGFDMKAGADGKTHFFGDHQDRIRSDYARTMLPNFPTLIEPLKARGVTVLNCTPDSALRCFPLAKLEDIL
jgi:hypothetical protein